MEPEKEVEESSSVIKQKKEVIENKEREKVEKKGFRATCCKEEGIELGVAFSCFFPISIVPN